MNTPERRRAAVGPVVPPTLLQQLCNPFDNMSETPSDPSLIMLDRSRALVPDTKVLPAWTSPQFPADSGRDDKSKVWPTGFSPDSM
jgi:hypothetical protein